METSHFIPTLRIGNKFREQSYLLNQSSSKILLIGDSIISNLCRYPEIWKKYFSSNNTLYFRIPGDKIQHVSWRIQNLNFSNNFSIQYIFIFSATNNLDHNPLNEFANGIILSGISAKKQCHNATIVLIPLLSCSKKDLIRRRNIDITNRLLEEESGKHGLYLLKHSKSWLNADQSLNMNLFYEDGLHLIKEGNDFLAKEIMNFYKELSFTVYNPPRISYKNTASFLIILMTSCHYSQTKLSANQHQFTYP